MIASCQYEVDTNGKFIAKVLCIFETFSMKYKTHFLTVQSQRIGDLGANQRNVLKIHGENK